MADLKALLLECRNEISRWVSCQSIGTCRQCAPDGLIDRIDAALSAPDDPFAGAKPFDPASIEGKMPDAPF